jgi:hypothetical protein
MEMEANYQGIMWRISHLKIFSMNITSAPANIRALEASFESTHYFPYIRIYALILCEFKHNQLCDLRNLTHLTVTLGIILYDDVEVYLPALRHLACGALITGYCTRIDAPVLETLHLLPFNHNDRDVRHMIDTLNLDDSVLSPTKAITVDANLPQHTIVTFLEHSPHVERVSLSFADPYEAKKMLERMEGVTHLELASLSLADADEAEIMPERMEGATRVGNPEDCVLAGWLCERMVVLVINLVYETRDVEAWKRRASRLVESRRTFGFHLHVYAAWRGDGAYVLLACPNISSGQSAGL